MSAVSTVSGIVTVAFLLLFIAWIAMLSLGGAGFLIGLLPTYGVLWTIILVAAVLKL